MLFKILVVSTIVMMILNGPVQSFDGNRKGMVLGGGLGIGRVAGTTSIRLQNKSNSLRYFVWPGRVARTLVRVS